MQACAMFRLCMRNLARAWLSAAAAALLVQFFERLSHSEKDTYYICQSDRL
jgi:hypothetical protein